MQRADAAADAVGGVTGDARTCSLAASRTEPSICDGIYSAPCRCATIGAPRSAASCVESQPAARAVIVATIMSPMRRRCGSWRAGSSMSRSKIAAKVCRLAT